MRKSNPVVMPAVMVIVTVLAIAIVNVIGTFIY